MQYLEEVEQYHLTAASVFFLPDAMAKRKAEKRNKKYLKYPQISKPTEDTNK